MLTCTLDLINCIECVSVGLRGIASPSLLWNKSIVVVYHVLLCQSDLGLLRNRSAVLAGRALVSKYF